MCSFPMKITLSPIWFYSIRKMIAAQYVQYFKQMAEDFQLENDLTVSQLGRCPEVFAMEESTVDEKEDLGTFGKSA